MPMGTPPADVAGLMLVDKPAGVTSHDVVAAVRRAAGGVRTGHAGTLDPFATGLLVLLLGRATRLMPYLDGEPKVYDATICFGAETETDDATGAVTREAQPPEAAAIDEGIRRLTGAFQQVPPAYSAKKIAGVRAYDAARRGEGLDLAPTPVVVHVWKIRSRSAYELDARITCSGGTYIRALARDLGRRTGSAAHLTRLRRIASGPYTVAEAVTVDQVRSGELPLRPPRDIVASLPAHVVNAADHLAVSRGRAVTAEAGPIGERVALLDDEQMLIAVAERVGAEGALLQPRVVLADA
ncbi:MAG: tRNA pseudouridine(55) synthase TruB [Gemmatimonadales bacterium]